MSKIVSKKFKIIGMHCSACAMNIDFDLEDLKGVQSVNTNYAKEICEVVYEPENVTETDIVDQIKKTGYDSVVL